MIDFLQIHTTDTRHYRFFEDLLTSSFPPEEYRDPEEQRRHTDHTRNFYCNLLLAEHRPIGLVTYWRFTDFTYIEHFAIHPLYRNKRYGEQALQALLRQFSEPVVLEVELPTTEMAQRRIGFYSRQGFTCWLEAYKQPPYRPGDDYLPMLLMVHGALDPTEAYEHIKQTIYQHVYGISPHSL